MRARSGQLSVETMIIYGLVILIALSVIGGLLYFNVLDLGSYLPDKCTLGGVGDLKCEEMKFGGNTLELGITNIGQKPIELLAVFVTDDDSVHFSGTIESSSTTVDGDDIGADNSLAPGEIALVQFESDDMASETGKLLRGTLVTKYKYKGGVVEQECTGSIRVKAS